MERKTGGKETMSILRLHCYDLGENDCDNGRAARSWDLRKEGTTERKTERKLKYLIFLTMFL